MVWIWHFWQGSHQIYSHMWCILYGSGQQTLLVPSANLPKNQTMPIHRQMKSHGSRSYTDSYASDLLCCASWHTHNLEVTRSFHYWEHWLCPQNHMWHTHTQLGSDSLVSLLRTLAVLTESYDTHTQLGSDSLVSLLRTLAVPAESYDTHTTWKWLARLIIKNIGCARRVIWHTHNLKVTRSFNYWEHWLYSQSHMTHTHNL